MIQVTQEDIDNGAKSDACSCPIAKAILRQVPRAIHVAVCQVSIYVSDGLGRETKMVPKQVANFIDEFDSGRPVHPFEFELDLPTGG